MAADWAPHTALHAAGMSSETIECDAEAEAGQSSLECCAEGEHAGSGARCAASHCSAVLLLWPAGTYFASSWSLDKPPMKF